MKRMTFAPWPMALALLLLASGTARGDSRVDDTDRYAYLANAGWLNMQGDVAQGARFTPSHAAGYIHSANLGWIHLGDGSPINGVAYSNARADDCGVNVDATGSPQAYLLSGYAYGANIGWINFDVAAQTGEANRPRIDKVTGQMQGYAWGANIGWLILEASEFARVKVRFSTAAEDWTLYP